MTNATIVVSADASKWEQRAAEDLQRYIERMSGAKPALTAAPDANGAAPGKTGAPLILVGQQALAAEPKLQKALDAVAKKNPTVRADAIVLKRAGNRVYVAGTNDESHYFAVAALLQQWGCRWYLPGEFGECIPGQPLLKVGTLDYCLCAAFRGAALLAELERGRHRRGGFSATEFHEQHASRRHGPRARAIHGEADPAGENDVQRAAFRGRHRAGSRRADRAGICQGRAGNFACDRRRELRERLRARQGTAGWHLRQIHAPAVEHGRDDDALQPGSAHPAREASRKQNHARRAWPTRTSRCRRSGCSPSSRIS